MRLFITDVSVLFDLYAIGALPEFFALDVEISTTAFVYNEIIQADQKGIFENFRRSHQLKVLEFAEEELAELEEFKTHLSNRSMGDRSIIWKATQLKAIVLTCDAKLKKEAEYQKIEVHGSIWVIAELEKQGIIDKGKAIDLLEQLKTVNSRLPFNEIEQIIKHLKK